MRGNLSASTTSAFQVTFDVACSNISKIQHVSHFLEHLLFSSNLKRVNIKLGKEHN